MIAVFNVLQLVLYIALLMLFGQGVLWVLAGAKREGNLVYQLFQLANRPWVRAARWISPRRIADRQLPFVAFFALGVIYLAVTLAKIEHCVSVNMVGCR